MAIGTALIVPGDEALVERIRELSTSFGGEVGISCWNGFAMARFCAQDAARLRADMMAVLGRASGDGAAAALAQLDTRLNYIMAQLDQIKIIRVLA